MISLDIVKALEALPLWKKLSALPERVDQLERRLAALEASKATVPSAGTCNFCQGALRVIGEAPHPHFDFAGHKVLTLECQNPSCGKTTTKHDRGRG
ncbi:hypothetical protein [Brevundimonas naejangsanensis]|uniref:hypothetical protein n=1 Tax=Brevundimonas naejangsanensis TaxID=588932 RepID=UPI0026E966C2|nr:hypothetical protein [Brevundimonas naejangsanensis]